MQAAERSRREKNATEEQAHFRQAAKNARHEDDQAEALYRLAHSYLRDGDLQTAAMAFEELGVVHANSTRAARAWLDAGRTWEKLEDRKRALAAYRHVTQQYAASGSAIAAAKRDVALSPPPAHERWARISQENSDPALAPALFYHWAQSLEEADPVAAIRLYEKVATIEPIPQGSHSDDALLNAAKLRRSVGDFKGALATLEVLIEQDNKTAIVGSYTRESYVNALFLKGIILREDLQRLASAHEVFVSLPDRYPSSRLVDDSLWEACITTKRSGASACTDVARLRKTSPQSRYLRCASWLCPEENKGSSSSAECARWAGAHSN